MPRTPAADATADPRLPIQVCPDASVGRRGPALAGVAWVASDGTYAFDAVGTCSPLVAELAAIRMVIDDHPANRSMVVLTDCQTAVTLLTRFRSNGSIPIRSGVHGAEDIARLLRTITIELRRRPIELQWIKGHAGHPLNEAADRLAVQARRCVQNGGRLTALAGLAARIVSESDVAA